MNRDQVLSDGSQLMGGNYTVEQQLSSGGFGNTYVVHNRLDKVFAMKEFFIKGVNLRTDGMVTVSVPDNKVTFESQRAKFEKEAKRLSKIDNPHIVKVHDLFYENGTAYYTMDYIDGESLVDYLKQTGKPLPEEEVMRILHQVLDALESVHGQGIYHLDLKPANIMQDKRGNVFLIDFGASKQLGADENGVSTSTMICQTPGYAPLEQVAQNLEQIGPWTDFYALGATLYNLLTNISPSTIEIGEEPSYPSSVSVKMRKLIEWMMQPSRKKRPQTVNEVQARLSATPTMDSLMQENTESPTGRRLDSEQTIIDHVAERNPSQTPPPVIHRDEEKTVFTQVDRRSYRESVRYRQEQKEEQSGRSFFRKLKNVFYKSNADIIEDLINNMVPVVGGTFTMGATSEQGYDAYENEKPAHQVTLSSFSIGKFEVTIDEWKAVMGGTTFFSLSKPVVNVSWDDCQKFIRKLNAMTNRKFRLPTEAEWEYAARGGNKSRGYKYAGSNDIGTVAWYEGNSGAKPFPVGLKQPNELGLYDMSGNVYEWCQDWDDGFSSDSQTNPSGPSSGSLHVARGGCWHSTANGCRVSFRNSVPDCRSNDLGLRLVLQ